MAKAEISLFREQTSFGANPAFCQIGIRGSLSGVKQLGHNGNYRPPSSARVQNVLYYTSTPLYIFMAWYLRKKTTLSSPCL
jgi:hypothetical protein